ncbi:amyloid-beta A4 precursor protein-binding family A member 3 isoform X2 [Equus asinus]|uniref:amyloid-beta A4 precursor protein-binding family A member 3 isoform X2 n=1 Tax=Equus asinus TaxID=9793 RepID=UPI0038F76693
MEFLTPPRPPPGPPAMDLEEPGGSLSPSQDAPRDLQWAPAPGGPGSLSHMELDGPSVEDLVQQFETLPGDLGGLSPDGPPCPLHIATGHGLAPQDVADAHGLLSAEAGRDDLLSLLRLEEAVPSPSYPEEPPDPAPHLLQPPEDPEEESGPPEWAEGASAEQGGSRSSSSSPEPWLETVPLVAPAGPPTGAQSPATPASPASRPALQEAPGPCDYEDLLDGVIFAAKYLGSTQLLSPRNPPPSARMAQAQEAVDRVKAPDGETQPMTDVDLFVSTKRVKVLTADSQEAMMDHALQTISYIADIGSVLVLMARRRARRPPPAAGSPRLCKMLCHVFRADDAQLIAQAIGQAFAVAYSQFLRDSGLDPGQVAARQGQGAAGPGHLHNGDLDHFSNSDNCREVCIEKRRGEALGVALVESGWGSLLPTAVIANLLHGGPAERSGALSIGDRLTAINGASLVGLPLAACQAAVRICSLLRGGIAERGGVRVGHRIIEINGQSVVATPHARIIELLTEAHVEVRGAGDKGGRPPPAPAQPPALSPRSTSRPCRSPPTACSPARSSPCTCDGRRRCHRRALAPCPEPSAAAGPPGPPALHYIGCKKLNVYRTGKSSDRSLWG